MVIVVESEDVAMERESSRESVNLGVDARQRRTVVYSKLTCRFIELNCRGRSLEGPLNFCGTTKTFSYNIVWKGQV